MTAKAAVLDLTLESVSFAPVMKNRQDSVDYWADTVLAQDLPEKVAWRFTNYLRRCLDGREKTYREVKFKDASGRQLKEKLNNLLATSPTAKVKRNDITKELANLLCIEMQKAPKPAAGAIFIIQGDWKGKKHVAIVKLDLTALEVIELRVRENTRNLLYNAFERTLPGSDTNFRKGVVFPSPGDGHARSGQHDTDARYWDRFVGAELYRDAETNTDNVTAITKVVAQENGAKMQAPEMVNLVAELSKLDATDAGEVAAAIDKATGRKKRTSTIVSRLKEVAGDGGIPRLAPLARVLYKVSRDSLSFSVPAALVGSGEVVVEQKGRNVVITIKDAEFDYETIVGKDRR